ncbi:hypothetical protein F4703DRAFT_1134166 [Phycomyces blakesleeanus]
MYVNWCPVIYFTFYVIYMYVCMYVCMYLCQALLIHLIHRYNFCIIRFLFIHTYIYVYITFGHYYTKQI